MKTVLVTGGTDGIGKGMALYYLHKGYEVIAVGSTSLKGSQLMEDAAAIGKESQITFIQADLSLIQENLRVVKLVSEKINSLDALILCAASLKPQKSYTETPEGYEFTFALYYLSRCILCYQLKQLLENAENPVILNVCAPGMSGKIHWNDIQMKQKYNGQNAQFHGSRLNDLLAVSFHEKDALKKIRYILFNPMAARTNGASKMGAGNPFMKLSMKLYYKYRGKNVDEIISVIDQILHNTSDPKLTAYKLSESVDMNMDTFNKNKAQRLENYTKELLLSN